VIEMGRWGVLHRSFEKMKRWNYDLDMYESLFFDDLT
jgi:hypothetical protein